MQEVIKEEEGIEIFCIVYAKSIFLAMDIFLWGGIMTSPEIVGCYAAIPGISRKIITK